MSSRGGSSCGTRKLEAADSAAASQAELPCTFSARRRPVGDARMAARAAKTAAGWTTRGSIPQEAFRLAPAVAARSRRGRGRGIAEMLEHEASKATKQGPQGCLENDLRPFSDRTTRSHCHALIFRPHVQLSDRTTSQTEGQFEFILSLRCSRF